jgi:Ni,Fe-hydrogenase III small subunit
MKRYAHSLGVRHAACGSCNACEHEMNALESPQYDIAQEGWHIAASPRQADVLTVSGPMTQPMREPAAATAQAMANPRVVVAVGDCAIGTGVWSAGPRAGSGAGVELHAQVEVPGCPPSPDAIKAGLRRAAALLDESI